MGLPPPDAPRELLARLTAPDSDEYGPAAGRGRVRSPWLLVTTVVLGALLTVAAVETQADRPQAERDRLVLLERLEQEKADVARLGQRAEAAAAEVASLRASTVTAAESVRALQVQLDDLGAVVGSAAVRGPGVRVVVDDSSNGKPAGAVVDTDLQRLVNGLWEAGAEAVAINGQRLTALSAIRTAGQAITVNYRSLAPPYTVLALGDPAAMPARLLETDAGQAFTDLRNNFGVHFDVDTRAELTLPAGSRLILDDSAPVTRPGAR